jgi:two-component system cell cycle response regulator DivK
LGIAPQRRILVVDDNEWNLKLVRMLLASEHQIATAATGAAALTAAATFKPELVLLDLQLPDIDGLTLARQLKADPALAGIRIVALTAHTISEVADAARLAGCEAVLSKPLDPAAFRETVRVYLGGAPPG